eukprot:Nk52_evm89s2367 gene=Nk52_evmTU89s2367
MVDDISNSYSWWCGMYGTVWSIAFPSSSFSNVQVQPDTDISLCFQDTLLLPITHLLSLLAAVLSVGVITRVLLPKAEKRKRRKTSTRDDDNQGGWYYSKVNPLAVMARVVLLLAMFVLQMVPMIAFAVRPRVIPHPGASQGVDENEYGLLYGARWLQQSLSLISTGVSLLVVLFVQKMRGSHRIHKIPVDGSISFPSRISLVGSFRSFSTAFITPSYLDGLMFIPWLLTLLVGLIKYRTLLELVLYGSSNGQSEYYFPSGSSVVYIDAVCFLVFLPLLFLWVIVVGTIPETKVYCFSCPSSSLRVLENSSKYDHKERLCKSRLQSDKTPPEFNASCLSSLLLWWITPLLWLGTKRPLQEKDLPNVPEDLQAAYLLGRFCSIFYSEKDNTAIDGHGNKAQRRTRSIFYRALSAAVGSEIKRAGLLKLGHDLLLFVSPLLVRLLIQFINDENEPAWHGYVYGGALTLVAWVTSILLQHYFAICFTTGLKLRSLLMAAVYNATVAKPKRKDNGLDKTRASGGSLSSSSSNAGSIVNLLSVDSQRFMDLMPYIHLIWSSPLQIGLSLYFLFDLFGVSTLVGIAVMVMAIPLNGWIAKQTGLLQKVLMGHKDKRVQATNESISNIRLLKFNVWEDHFIGKIESHREKEVALNTKTQYLKTLSVLSFTLMPFIVSLVTFVTYEALHPNQLTSEKVFVGLSYFNIIQFPLTMLPTMINSLMEVQVAARRMASYLQTTSSSTPSCAPGGGDKSGRLSSIGAMAVDNNERGLDCDESYLVEVTRDNAKKNAKELKEQTAAVVFDNASFEWHNISSASTKDGFTSPRSELLLPNTTLRIPAGRLTAVVGRSGSGKSALISALLGELIPISGSVLSPSSSVAYVAQQPWIRNTSVRENIIMLPSSANASYEDVTLASCGFENNYLAALRAARLNEDLATFPDGDAHKCGSNGARLSGGQRQRVAIARAVFHSLQMDPEALVVFDDPLSALDARVGKQVFDICLASDHGDEQQDPAKRTKGVLGNQTRIISTHRVNLLPLCDYVIVMDEGRVDWHGEWSNFPKEWLALEKYAFLHSETAAGHIDTDMDMLSCKESSNTGNTSPKKSSSTSSIPPSGSNVQGSGSASPGKAPSVNDQQMEKQEVGNISASVYFHYFAALKNSRVILIFVLYFAAYAASVLSSLWLSRWTNSIDEAQALLSDEVNDGYFELYSLFGLAQVFILALGMFLLTFSTTKAAQNLHEKMLVRVIRAPLRFFEGGKSTFLCDSASSLITAPSTGAIVNRFSKDVYVLDETIPNAIRTFLSASFRVLVTLVIVSYSTPLVLFPVPVLLGLNFVIQRGFIASNRQLKRIESVQRSPVLALFVETYSGAPTIRAMKREDMFSSTFSTLLDRNQEASYPSAIATRWLSLVLEILGGLFILAAAAFTVEARDELDAGTVGLSLSLAISVTPAMNWMVRQTSELETFIVSAERVREYTLLCDEEEERRQGLEAKRQLQKQHDSSKGGVISSVSHYADPGDDWPKDGSIHFNTYSLIYPGDNSSISGDGGYEHHNSACNEGTRALDRVDLHVSSGAYASVVGRSGAGKSSLIEVLLGVATSPLEENGEEMSESLSNPLRGHAFVGGIDIDTIPLPQLRRAITVIPQQPYLFEATLRDNVDPCERFSDMQVWEAITKAGLEYRFLQHHHPSTPNDQFQSALHTHIEAGGANLSTGERQLVCMARALLQSHHSKVIILDEQTASMDTATDNHIQALLRSQFSATSSTILSITHRLDGILHGIEEGGQQQQQQVVVMDKGRVVQHGTPRDLLSISSTHEENIFALLVQASLATVSPPSSSSTSSATK